MIKTIGLVMIVTSCSMMGISMGREMEKRKLLLRDHIAALELIRTEICYKNTPMDEILIRLADHCREETLTFYKNAFEAASSGLAFSTAAEKQYEQLKKDGLAEEDIDGIRAACRTLGRYDSVTQSEQLAAAIVLLDKELQVLQSEISSKERIYKTAGATVGIALALMVI